MGNLIDLHKDHIESAKATKGMGYNYTWINPLDVNCFTSSAQHTEQA